jgi:hypothetical protein
MAEPSTFSPTDRKDLAAALGRQDIDAFCRWLAERVRLYKCDAARARLNRESDAHLRDWMRRTQDLALEFLTHLENAKDTDREYYLDRFMEWGIQERRDFRGALCEMVERIEYANMRYPRKAHRPTDWARAYLDRDIAKALAACGYQVTKGRDGVYARVLSVAYRAADLPAQDLFRAIRRAVDRMDLPDTDTEVSLK